MNSLFSQKWNDSDQVLTVERKELHVHRCILSLQSPAFKAMFNGNFKDATQDKIELKDENYEAMLQFLQLLYPPNMLDNIKVSINDENILKILEVADKYAAINVIKQCMQETPNLVPENVMRLLPYAVRYALPCQEIFDVINRQVPTENLKNFAPELGNNSVYAETLFMKCRFLENTVERSHAMLLHVLKRAVRMSRKITKETHETAAKCVQHGAILAMDFEKTAKCNNCLEAYNRLIEKHMFPSNCADKYDLLKNPSMNKPPRASSGLLNLLRITNDVFLSSLYTHSNDENMTPGQDD